jgi:3-oxoacyl-[acyl-carrier protein] reductase
LEPIRKNPDWFQLYLSVSDERKEMRMKRTVLITGASRGIGRAIAECFAEHGYQVGINYCSSHREAIGLKQDLCEKYGEEAAELFQGDVSKEEEVRRIGKEISDRFGGIDVLINNAGVAQQKLLTQTTMEDWDTLFGINARGTFLCSREFLPRMIQKQKGKIINISSMWGITGASCEVAYSASKAAIIGFTKALAKEVGPSHINVNCIAPGVIQTQMNDALDEETLNALREETPLEMLGTGMDVAQLALFLASEKADFITGQVISVDGGMVI